MSQIRIIIGREFNERVRKKSFIVSTLLMPVLLLGLMLAPALIMQFSRGETKRIAVIDRSGLVLPQLESDSELAFEATDLPLERARRELTDRFGILWIGPDPVAQPDDIRLYANASSSISIESNITGQIEKIVENEKLKGYDIENLALLLGGAGVNYILGVPAGDDVMLNYQTNAYHDVNAIREVLGLRPIPEFEAWLEKMGLMENGRLTGRAGDPTIFAKGR